MSIIKNNDQEKKIRPVYDRSSRCTNIWVHFMPNRQQIHGQILITSGTRQPVYY